MITFMGTDGTLYIDRGRYELNPEPGKGKSEALILGTNPQKGAGLLRQARRRAASPDQLGRVHSQPQKPTAPAEAGVSAAAAAHLGNRAYRNGLVVGWLPC